LIDRDVALLRSFQVDDWRRSSISIFAGSNADPEWITAFVGKNIQGRAIKQSYTMGIDPRVSFGYFRLFVYVAGVFFDVVFRKETYCILFFPLLGFMLVEASDGHFEKSSFHWR
jgi:hypothetical protein